MTEGAGVPIGVTVAGANTHDKHLVEETLESIPVEPPDPERVQQHLCLDKGYDYADVRELVETWGYVGHIKSPAKSNAPREYQAFEHGYGFVNARIRG